ncbi:hypothetical protein D9M71_491920 [compost metagenome]
MFGQEGVKIVGHLGMAFHPQVGLGKATLTATLFTACPFQNRDTQSSFSTRHGCRQTGDTATQHNQIEIQLSHR